MSDLPSQGLFQQLHANPHSGEYLEVLGKKAAANWGAGQHKSLTEAVTETVKQAQLSPEQVKRVVEFANTTAYLSDFKKEGGTHHVVDFPGGPANVSEILKDLNDGGGGSVFDRGTLDYTSPPAHEKIASDPAEEALTALFGTPSVECPYESDHAPVIDLHDKLAGAADHLQSQVSGLEVNYADLADRVYFQVKQAALSGISLRDVMQAWETVAPTAEYVKIGFELVTPRLLADGVFYNVDQMVASVEKTASQKMVNTAHPLVAEFGEFCETLGKLAELRETRAEVCENRDKLAEYIKLASLAGIARGTARAAEGAAKVVGPLVGKAVGSDAAGSVAHTAVKYAPHMAGALAASEAYNHVANSPSLPARAARGTADVVARNIPGTDANRRHKWEIQNGQ